MGQIAAFYASSVSLAKAPEGFTRFNATARLCTSLCSKTEGQPPIVPAAIRFCQAIGRNGSLNAFNTDAQLLFSSAEMVRNWSEITKERTKYLTVCKKTKTKIISQTVVFML